MEAPATEEPATEEPDDESPGDDAPAQPGTLFDGRLAVVTRLGQRIPIADVYPLFACSVRGSPESRSLSADVQCSVFQIRTPAGEVYTLPLHEITAFHALSAELIQRLEAAAQARARKADRDQSTPFGFAAFTSLARSQSPGIQSQSAGPKAHDRKPSRM